MGARVAAVIETELKRHAGTTLQELANRAEHLAAETISSYRLGLRNPSPRSIETLGRLFYPVATAKRQQFVKVLTEAAAADRAPRRRQRRPRWLELMKGQPIDLLSYDFGSFNKQISTRQVADADDPNSGFCDGMFWRFLKFSFINPKVSPPLKPEAADFDVLTRRMADGTCDFALGALATPDRALVMQSYALPIRVKVNAVFMRNSRHPDVSVTRERIADFLSVRTSVAADHLAFITRPGEIGHNYVRKSLNINPKQDFTIAGGTPEDYAKALRRASDDAAGLMPIVVCDEYTCLRMLGSLELQGAAALVFPISGAQGRAGHMPMPAYPLAFSVSRQQAQLAAFFLEAFHLYVGADIEAIARKYAALFVDLVETVEANLKYEADGKDAAGCAVKWTEFTLGLDNTTMPLVDPVWSSVIGRAKSLIPNVRPGEAAGDV